VLQQYLDLTDQQRSRIMELKHKFVSCIEPIMDERKHLNAAIKSSL
jgi:hypothetical protein